MEKQRNVFFEKTILWVAVFASVIFFFRYLSEAALQGKGVAEDFEVFYRTAQNLISGQVRPYYNDPAADYFPYLYTPFFLFILYPLNWFGYETAQALWFGGQILFFAFAARYYLTNVPLAEGENKSAKVLFVALPFILITVLSGQMGLLTSGLLLLGFALFDKKPVAAGIIFALISFKPQLVLLLPFALLARRAWPTIISGAVTFTVLVAASVTVYGSAVWIEFFNALTIHAEVVKTLPQKMLTPMISPYIGLRMLGLGHLPAFSIHMSIALAAIIHTYKIFRSQNKSPELVFFILMFLISPYAFVYDFPVLAVTLFVIMATKITYPAGRVALIFGLFMPVIGAQLQAGGLPALSGMFMFLVVLALGLRLEK